MSHSAYTKPCLLEFITNIYLPHFRSQSMSLVITEGYLVAAQMARKASSQQETRWTLEIAFRKLLLWNQQKKYSI